MESTTSVSIVIPIFNESESLLQLSDKIYNVFENELTKIPFEIIFVDDGSTDNTQKVLKILLDSKKNIKVITFRKNFGKSAALMAGFDEASGNIVFTMDGDLQDEPSEIPRFLERIEQGFDLVSGWKADRKDPLEKKIPSLFFNFIVSSLTKVKIHDFNCGFKAYKKWCVKALKIYGNQHRFIPAILSWHGAKIAEIPVKHHKRSFGVSKFGMSRYFHGAFDLFTLLISTKFSQNPLYFFGIIGLPFALSGSIVLGYLIISHFAFLLGFEIGVQLNSRPLLVISFSSLIIGLQICLIGLIAEMVLRASSNQKSFMIERKESSKEQEDLLNS